LCQLGNGCPSKKKKKKKSGRLETFQTCVAIALAFTSELSGDRMYWLIVGPDLKSQTPDLGSMF
jgi:hypothetical protein